MKVRNTEFYILKHFDTDVLTLELNQSQDIFDIELLELLDEKLLPISVVFTKESVKQWILDRIIDDRKYNIDDWLTYLNIDYSDKKSLIKASKCMTFKDPYWIKNAEDKGLFRDYNFYDKPLVKNLSSVNFDTAKHYYLKKRNCSPELTTVSSFKTCWIKEKGQIYLLKSANIKDDDKIMQMYSELLCFELARNLGVKCVDTLLINHGKHLCLKQALFLNKNIGYISANKVIGSNKIDDVMIFCIKQGAHFVKTLKDMLLFDVITCNNARTLKDFGFLVDNKQNKIIAFAPLFKNGTSLFYDGVYYDINNYKQYEQESLPIIADSLLQVYRDYLLDTPQSRLDQLVGFKFNRNRPYLLWEERLLSIELFIQKRIVELKKII